MTGEDKKRLQFLLNGCKILSADAERELASHEGNGTASNLLMRQIEELHAYAKEAYQIV